MASILHPTDFSKTSRSAFEYALYLALVGKHELVLMHVDANGIDNSAMSGFPHVREMLHKWGVVPNDMPAAELKHHTGISVRKVLAEGKNLGATVKHFLRNHPADLIVVGTQGRDGVEAWFDKSNAIALADTVHEPVLFVREGLQGISNVDLANKDMKILVPVDSEPDPQQAVDWAFHLKYAWSLPVTSVETLHVGDTPLKSPIHFRPDPTITTHQHNTTQSGVDDGIVRTAADSNSDMIVMTRSGPEGFKERFAGSTSQKVVRHAPCPVLLLPVPSYDDAAD